MIIKEKIIDLETGTEFVIDRELTDLEIAERQTAQQEIQALLAQNAAKEAARQAVLEKLGLTADDAAALLG